MRSFVDDHLRHDAIKGPKYRQQESEALIADPLLVVIA